MSSSDTRGDPKENIRGLKTTVLSFLGCVAYATIRYNIIKGVPWSDWPTVILNKAISLAALVLMMICVIRRCVIPGVSNALLMRVISAFIAIHVVMSLALWKSPHYEKFLPNGNMTLLSGLSMLLGVIVTWVFFMGKRPRSSLSPVQKARRLAILAIVTGIHAGLVGYGVWLTPSKWPGYMPPITLLSFLMGVTAVAFAYARKLRA